MDMSCPDIHAKCIARVDLDMSRAICVYICVYLFTYINIYICDIVCI